MAPRLKKTRTEPVQEPVPCWSKRANSVVLLYPSFLRSSCSAPSSFFLLISSTVLSLLIPLPLLLCLFSPLTFCPPLPYAILSSVQRLSCHSSYSAFVSPLSFHSCHFCSSFLLGGVFYYPSLFPSPLLVLPIFHLVFYSILSCLCYQCLPSWFHYIHPVSFPPLQINVIESKKKTEVLNAVSLTLAFY